MTRTTREGVEIDGTIWTVCRVPMETDSIGGGGFVGIEFRSGEEVRRVRFSPFRLPSEAAFRGINDLKLKALLSMAEDANASG